MPDLASHTPTLKGAIMQYKSIYFAILTLFITLSLFGDPTGSLSGFILEQNGKPIEYASVYLQGINIGANSDGLGRYCLTKIPPGTYTLSGWGMGYLRPNIENITIDADEEKTLDVVLQRDPEGVFSKNDPFAKASWVSGGIESGVFIIAWHIKQSDETVIDIERVIIVENSIQYYWDRKDGYTLGYDTWKNNWCWLKQTKDGKIKSTGYPIHRHDPQKLGLPKNIRMTHNEYFRWWNNYYKDIGYIEL